MCSLIRSSRTSPVIRSKWYNFLHHSVLKLVRFLLLIFVSKHRVPPSGKSQTGLVSSPSSIQEFLPWIVGRSQSQHLFWQASPVINQRFPVLNDVSCLSCSQFNLSALVKARHPAPNNDERSPTERLWKSCFCRPPVVYGPALLRWCTGVLHGVLVHCNINVYSGYIVDIKLASCS